MTTKTNGSEAIVLREERAGAPNPIVLAYVERPSEIRAARFAACQPTTLASVLNRAASGEMEDWHELVDRMLETDAQLSSLVETRNDLLTGCEWTIEPGKAKPGDESLAQEGAHLIREQLACVDDVEAIYADLNFGLFSGLAAQEHNWCMEGGLWNSYPEFRAPKLFRFDPEWDTQVRDRDRQWVPVPARKFIIHTPRSRATYPTRGALLRDVSWEWCFKFWVVFYWMSGAERLGNPIPVGTVEANTDARVRADLQANIERITVGQAAVLTKNTGIEFPDTGFGTSADVWERLEKTFSFAQSKRLIGSTLNVEIGETGGAYAAADSQAVTTIRPRILKDAKKLNATIRRHWFEPLLAFNSHAFNGRVPPLPKIVWRVKVGEQKPDAAVTGQLITGGAIRVNELREIAGLPKIEGAAGDAMVAAAPAPAPAAPSFSSPPGGAAAERPFSDRRARRSTSGSTTPTSSRSPARTNPLRRAL